MLNMFRQLLRRGAWLTVCFLSAAGVVRAVDVSQKGDQWLIENEQVRVIVDAKAAKLTVQAKEGGGEWMQASAPGAPVRVPFRDIKALEGGARGVGFETDFAAANGQTYTLDVKLTLPEKGADLRVEADMADRTAKIEDIPFLDPFVLDSTSGAIAVADLANGHLYPVDEKPFPRKRFNLWDLDMPWIGVCDVRKGQGYAIIAETPDDAYFEMLTIPRGTREISAPRVVWTQSLRTFRYPRCLLYYFSPRGSYVALAKRYRAYAKEQGLIVPFTEKLKKNPNIERAFGAPDVWGDSTLKFAQEAKAAGVEKMLIEGEASPEVLKAVNELGYLTSRYDCYHDVMPAKTEAEINDHLELVPENVVLMADGERMKAWLTWDKQQYMKRCPAFWVRTAKLVIPKDLAEHPYLGRFIDVTTAEGLYECYDPKHPLDRTEKRQCGVDLESYVRSLNLVTGGEHGRWWAVPYLDYVEGMMSGAWTSWPAGYLLRPKTKEQEFTYPSGGKCPKWEVYEKWGIGHQYRAPLWELVFHDCIITTWYWGDSSDYLIVAAPEVTQKKDAFNILYGTMPMMWADKEGSWVNDRDLFLRTYRNTCKLHEVLATAEMVSHEFVTPDRAVQRTRFSDGTEVVVNFGEQPYAAKVGGKSYRLPKNGFAVKGPKIEQSLALVNGKPVTEIKTANYHFTDAK
jgi:hypothetical protein